MKEIYLAGGCFWGVEGYFGKLNGVIKTEVGYANGHTKNPAYEEVCTKTTGHAETMRLAYDESVISLEMVLKHYFRIIDPTTIDRQGADFGNQYRTGIYYTDSNDAETIERALRELGKMYTEPIQVECMPLQVYFPAEEYHQKYLKKNPKGYCHVDLSLADMPLS